MSLKSRGSWWTDAQFRETNTWQPRSTWLMFHHTSALAVLAILALPWGREGAVAAMGQGAEWCPCGRPLCSAWSAVSKPRVPSKVSPCVVPPDIALLKWIWSMLFTSRLNKAKCLPIGLRWLLKFGFVLLCLHFYCPLTFHFPFSSVLCRVLPLSPVCYVPVSPFLSSRSLLLPCRAR